MTHPEPIATHVDPVIYEIFRHRLETVLEEGRLAIRMVSGSSVVIEGGETMCALYKSDGTPLLVAQGILLHCVGARDFIKHCIEAYEGSPGINDGDQFFYNDPYIGGQHSCDQVVIKPIFYNCERVAWVGSVMHTVEVGAMEPGGMPASATEIFQEGIRIFGLKIVDGGEFRQDVFNTITMQTRDPHMIGLDTKGRLAANNIIGRTYLELIEKYGFDVVRDASEKIIDESEAQARALLSSLPDGVWTSRIHGDDTSGGEDKPYRVVCTMTKRGDGITFDFTGSSPQNKCSNNETLPAAWGSLFVVLASHLFWNIHWSNGIFAPVTVVAPEGTVVNCRFPAACSNGVVTSGMMITESAHECIARMFYAAGRYDDVNAGWSSAGGGPYFGGINRKGELVSNMILDNFASGLGGTPSRDGVDTGAQMMNPQSNINDVESLEFNVPLMLLARRQMPDSGGFGKRPGGMGPESAYMVYGIDGLMVGSIGQGRRAPGSFGLFGGYPPGLQEMRFALGSDVRDWFAAGRSPRSADQLTEINAQTILDTPRTLPIIPTREYDIVIYNMSGGGGYGDPLERDPELVRADLERGAISADTASLVYGVEADQTTLEVDVAATEACRAMIRRERSDQGNVARLHNPSPAARTRRLVRFHESLAVDQKADGSLVTICLACDRELADARGNYKEHVGRRERTLSEVPLRHLKNGDRPWVVYVEYACPGCGTLLEVDTYCPETDGEERIIWDTRLDLDALLASSSREGPP